MARDDLFFHLFGHVSSRFGTPIRAQWLCGLIAALLACVPVDRLALFLSIGVLLSYTIVCAGVLVLRADSPQKAAKCSALVSLGDIRPPEADAQDLGGGARIALLFLHARILDASGCGNLSILSVAAPQKTIGKLIHTIRTWMSRSDS